jgi:hypothetical protein
LTEHPHLGLVKVGRDLADVSLDGTDRLREGLTFLGGGAEQAHRLLEHLDSHRAEDEPADAEAAALG